MVYDFCPSCHGRVPRAEALHSSPVLRGFSRSVKQDSEASNASGGVSNANVDVRDTTELKLLCLCRSKQRNRVACSEKTDAPSSYLRTNVSARHGMRKIIDGFFQKYLLSIFSEIVVIGGAKIYTVISNRGNLPTI
jgi:hypothetical protein